MPIVAAQSRDPVLAPFRAWSWLPSVFRLFTGPSETSRHKRASYRVRYPLILRPGLALCGLQLSRPQRRGAGTGFSPGTGTVSVVGMGTELETVWPSLDPLDANFS